MRIGIIVCAAGKGTRVGGDIPKQFIKIGEKRVIDYTLDNILMSGVFDDVVLVIRPGDRNEYEDYFGQVEFVDGDTEDGQNSRRLGLKYAKDVLGYEDDDLIGVADGNRPFITPEFYWMLVNVAKTKGNAIPYMIQRDILIRYDGEKVTLPGWSRNDKITTPDDVEMAKLIMKGLEN